MSDGIYALREENLSVAWARAFIKILHTPHLEIGPAAITVTGFQDGIVQENPRIMSALSQALTSLGKPPIPTHANTIFPQSLWNPQKDRTRLYERFLATWPKVKKCPANRLGHYFQRLIAYDAPGEPCNQLEHIISTYQKGNHRRSALQAGIFNPLKDHGDNKQRGFPCLQQVVFTPLGLNGRDGLSVTGFYAMQYVFEKAYGNYLGLCRLGRFMAHEMGLELVQMNCLSSILRLDRGLSKRNTEGLKAELEEILRPDPTSNPIKGSATP